jgi:phosphohistidine phosphatase
VHLILVHHGDAVGPDVDPRRPLSERGRTEVERLAGELAGRGVRPAVIWHSGKLRARQTADTFRRTCNPLSEFSATKDLQPDDPPQWIRDRLRGEARDILIAGHYPHLPRLLAMLLNTTEAAVSFPLHGAVALASSDDGEKWREIWRLEAGRTAD